jgi:hypothetical protein
MRAAADVRRRVAGSLMRTALFFRLFLLGEPARVQAGACVPPLLFIVMVPSALFPALVRVLSVSGCQVLTSDDGLGRKQRALVLQRGRKWG